MSSPNVPFLKINRETHPWKITSGENDQQRGLIAQETNVSDTTSMDKIMMTFPHASSPTMTSFLLISDIMWDGKPLLGLFDGENRRVIPSKSASNVHCGWLIDER
jgi:hypothetical protein